MNTIAQPTWRSTLPADTIPQERPLTIRFTGSGSEYFRIWIVNLLLSIVTLSLYRPWAKVRRLRYFYANTLVDDHALDFHGDPRKMLRGYLLVGAMVLTYSVASRLSAFAALVAFLALCVLWPALLRASMQFRLANTSWRGLRLRFSGDLGGAYAALLPVYLPALAFVALGLLVDDPRKPPSWYFRAIGAMAIVMALVVPWAWWKLKRYQHDHLGLGQWRTRLGVGPGPFYRLSLAVTGMFLLGMLVVFIGAVVIGIVAGVAGRGALGGHAPSLLTTVLTMAAGIVIWMTMLLLPLPYATSRLQNLVWSNTGCEALRFDSRLEARALLGITFRNWVLMLLTLGLYWPFAAVALYRARVEAITPRLSGDLDTLREDARVRAGDASGDAAGDLFGIDIGL
jgi:uncharacterized membrane protein YjgN (DUF898 family)